MILSGLHLLWTYQCTFECDHCFAWGSPWQTGTMTLEKLGDILGQAEELGTVEWIYFEGGEPFLYYKTLLSGAQMAADHGFRVGIVTNAYWAVDENDALERLKPFQYILDDLSISSDLYHSDEKMSEETQAALKAAEELTECPHEDAHADACHFCYEARRALRARFPEVLTPDQMYGVMEKN